MKKYMSLFLSLCYLQASDPFIEEAMKEIAPLTPEQIEQMKKLYLKVQEAKSTYEPPQSMISSRHVSLEPGRTPNLVRLAKGYISSLIFIDNTGQPWPIESYNLASNDAFNAQWNKEDNILMLQSNVIYGITNVVVKLQSFNTPIILTLISTHKVVDFRLDLHVNGWGPKAKISSVPPSKTIDSQLMSIVDGISPEKSTPLKVSHPGLQAWLMDGKYYLRTKYQLLSPAWISRLESRDDIHAYMLPPTPYVLVSAQGHSILVYITKSL